MLKNRTCSYVEAFFLISFWPRGQSPDGWSRRPEHGSNM